MPCLRIEESFDVRWFGVCMDYIGQFSFDKSKHLPIIVKRVDSLIQLERVKHLVRFEIFRVEDQKTKVFMEFVIFVKYGGDSLVNNMPIVGKSYLEATGEEEFWRHSFSRRNGKRE